MKRELEIKIKLEALITQREGMIAENQVRISLGQSVAFDGESFIYLADEIAELLN